MIARFSGQSKGFSSMWLKQRGDRRESSAKRCGPILPLLIWMACMTPTRPRSCCPRPDFGGDIYEAVHLGRIPVCDIGNISCAATANCSGRHFTLDGLESTGRHCHVLPVAELPLYFDSAFDRRLADLPFYFLGPGFSRHQRKWKNRQWPGVCHRRFAGH